jgi:hypothetical protein
MFYNIKAYNILLNRQLVACYKLFRKNVYNFVNNFITQARKYCYLCSNKLLKMIQMTETIQQTETGKNGKQKQQRVLPELQYTTQVNTRVTDATYAKLQARVALTKKKPSTVVRTAIAYYLDSLPE